jgi:hypothetical protein
MSYQGPVLIREPELRWPIVILAALITAAIAATAASLHYFAMTGPTPGPTPAVQLENALQAGQPGFDDLREQILIEQFRSTEKVNVLDHRTAEITATLRNETGRIITGLQLRAAMLDSEGSVLKERTVVVIPTRQTVLEREEAINVRVPLERISNDVNSAQTMLEVTAIRFD